MDPFRIANAANEIIRLSEALKWLREHGDSLNNRGSLVVTVRVNTASALPGANEAVAQLTTAVKVMIADLVALAIRDAENTIGLHRSAIKEEAAKE